MANNLEACLLRAMDSLWFHQIILFHEPPSSPFLPKTLKPVSTSLAYPSSNKPQSSHKEEEVSSAATNPLQDDFKINEDAKERVLKSCSLMIPSKSHSHSLLPTSRKPLKTPRYSGSVRRLNKTMSCKSLWELELEEVKGFVDLGFKFNRENMSPEILRILPGLQRLGGHKNEGKSKLMSTSGAEVDITDDDIEVEEEEEEEEEEDEEDEDEDERGVMRPYLSEAWLIKRPDSPLLNLRIPRVSAADDMKKHIRYWARTVASVILQDS